MNEAEETFTWNFCSARRGPFVTNEGFLLSRIPVVLVTANDK